MFNPFRKKLIITKNNDTHKIDISKVGVMHKVWNYHWGKNEICHFVMYYRDSNDTYFTRHITKDDKYYDSKGNEISMEQIFYFNKHKKIVSDDIAVEFFNNTNTSNGTSNDIHS